MFPERIKSIKPDLHSSTGKRIVPSLVAKCAFSYRAVYAIARPNGVDRDCEEKTESEGVIAVLNGKRARVAATPAVMFC